MHKQLIFLFIFMFSPTIYPMSNNNAHWDQLSSLFEKVWFHHQNDFGFSCNALFDGGLNAKNTQEESILEAAARIGQWKLVQLLILCGADVNYQRMVAGRPAGSILHQATLAGKYEIVELLLAHGAKIDCCNFQHQTPLDVADQGSEVSKGLLKSKYQQIEELLRTAPPMRVENNNELSDCARTMQLQLVRKRKTSSSD